MWTVIGHERVVEALARSVALGRLSHAYLFLGPPQVGKMTLALNLAQAVNCTGDDRPCGVCRHCLRTRDRKHADLLIVALGRNPTNQADAKEIGIEEIKALQQAVSVQPFEGRAKVSIVDGAEHLSGEAANRMLKTLEEPPDNVYFILLASEPAKVLPTVASRCRTYDLRPVPTAKIETALMTGYGVEPTQARTLARLAEGRVGWAIAAARDPGLLEARAYIMDEVEGLLYLPYEDRLSLSGRLADQFARDRDHLAQWLRLLRQWWRDLLLTKGERSHLVTNVDRQDALERCASQLSLLEIRAALRRIEETSAFLEQNANPRLALDVLLLHLPTRERDAAVVL